MKTIFANIEIKNLDGVKECVDAYKHFIPASESEKAEALEALISRIEEANANLRAEALAEITRAEDIVKALIPSIVLTEAEKAKSNVRKNAVAFAVSYPCFIVTEDEGSFTVREISKAVTLADVAKALVDIYAFNHADMQPTKADREKAVRTIVNGNARSLALFTTGAFAYENVADKLPKVMGMTEEEEKTFGGSPSKAKAERQIKALADAFGIDASKFKRVHGLALYKKCYTLDARFQPRTVDALTVLQSFIIVARYAINDLDLPDLVDKGGVLATIEKAERADTVSFGR